MWTHDVIHAQNRKYNVWQRRQRRDVTHPITRNRKWFYFEISQAQHDHAPPAGKLHQSHRHLVKLGPFGFEIYASERTDRQTDTVIIIFHTVPGAKYSLGRGLYSSEYRCRQPIIPRGASSLSVVSQAAIMRPQRILLMTSCAAAAAAWRSSSHLHVNNVVQEIFVLCAKRDLCVCRRRAE